MSDLQEFLKNEGYKFIREVPGHGLCGVLDMAYTWDLFCDMKKHGYYGRYTYKTMFEAANALKLWDGVGSPPGDWMHHHGGDGYYGNPRNADFCRWMGQVMVEVGKELPINPRKAWRYFEIGLTPLQYYFQVWIFENTTFIQSAEFLADDVPEPEIVEYVHEDSRLLWALTKYYFKQCPDLKFKEIITAEK